MNRTRILLVEDERLIRIIMAEALCEAGYEVIEAADGAQAIGLLEACGGLDLLLTDMQMPGADGNAVAARAKQIFPFLPVIYATGRPETLTNTVEGNDAVIRKPFGPAVVLALVLRLLNTQCGTDERQTAARPAPDRMVSQARYK